MRGIYQLVATEDLVCWHCDKVIKKGKLYLKVRAKHGKFHNHHLNGCGFVTTNPHIVRMPGSFGCGKRR